MLSPSSYDLLSQYLLVTIGSGDNWRSVGILEKVIEIVRQASSEDCWRVSYLAPSTQCKSCTSPTFSYDCDSLRKAASTSHLASCLRLSQEPTQKRVLRVISSEVVGLFAETDDGIELQHIELNSAVYCFSPCNNRPDILAVAVGTHHRPNPHEPQPPLHSDRYYFDAVRGIERTKRGHRCIRTRHVNHLPLPDAVDVWTVYPKATPNTMQIYAYKAIKRMPFSFNSRRIEISIFRYI